MNIFYDLGGNDNLCYLFDTRLPQPKEKVSEEVRVARKMNAMLVPDEIPPDDTAADRCEACGVMFNKWQMPLDGAKIRKKTYDAQHFLDGFMVVSEKFKEVYTQHHLKGLDFHPLPASPGFYMIYPSREVTIDVSRSSSLQFCEYCDACERYGEIVGPSSIKLVAGTTIDDDEFVRTDIEFSRRDELHPLILCGPVAMRALRSVKLKGLDLGPMRDIL